MHTTTQAGRRSVVAVGTIAAVTLLGMLAPAAGKATGPRVGDNSILFSSLRGGNDDIYRMDVDGGGQERLTTDPAYDSAPLASPDRSRIVFASEREGLMQVYVMAADGSGQRNLSNSGSFDFGPTWSHAGDRIFFQRLSDTTGFDLWVMDADGSHQHRLTSMPRNEVGPWVSPDDSTVTFSSNNGGDRDVWVMDADGSHPRNLTAGTCISGSDPCSLSYDFQSTWAPDGRIVFWSDRTGGIALWSMAADGSDPQLIVDLGEASVGLPSVSPNGKRVTFISDDAVTDERSVHTVRMDGSGLRRLTWTDDLNPRFPID